MISWSICHNRSASQGATPRRACIFSKWSRPIKATDSHARGQNELPPESFSTFLTGLLLGYGDEREGRCAAPPLTQWLTDCGLRYSLEMRARLRAGKSAASTGNSFSRNSPQVAIVHSSFAPRRLTQCESHSKSTSRSAKASAQNHSFFWHSTGEIFTKSKFECSLSSLILGHHKIK